MPLVVDAIREKSLHTAKLSVSWALLPSDDKSVGYGIFMRRERRRLQARHIWEKIEPDWPMIKERVWTKQATGLPYEALFYEAKK